MLLKKASQKRFYKNRKSPAEMSISSSFSSSCETASPRALLEFMLAAGVDLFIGEEPLNRLVLPPPASVVASKPMASTPVTRAEVQSSAQVLAPDEAVMQARALARSAPDLAALEKLLVEFEGCALKRTASRLVFADGAPTARLMIIGEAPGREEDEIGRPFVGRAGQLLDLMLAAIGLGRGQVYIANLVPWRPPGNRTPTPQEIAICAPFLARQIALVAPDCLLTLGAPASQSLLQQKDGILRLRGRWLEYICEGEEPKKIPALASLHPAYLLRQPAQKALAWRDLRQIAAKLRG